MGARRFNDREHPYTVLLGLPPHLVTALQKVLPGAEATNWISTIFEPDFDLLISWGQQVDRVAPHMFVVAFGDGGLCRLPDGRGLIRTSVRATPGGGPSFRLCVAREFETPDGLPSAFDELVSSDLAPKAKAEGSHSGLTTVPDYSNDTPGFTPLLTASDGTVLAGYFERAPGGGRGLSLPDGADVVAWVTAAINVWHDIDPKRFPGRLDWTNHSLGWDPPDVLAAVARCGEATIALGNAQKAVDTALEGYAIAKAEAMSGPFGMLMQSGDQLVAAVATALSDLGFLVRDMDKEWPEGKRLEDLRVRTPDLVGWEALVEVKGYSRGYGKAADLMTISARFAKAYRLSEKREPSALWYVVNHEPTVDPGARKQVLDSSDADIEVFADADGLAIDTVDLYRLWRDVQQGKLTAETARQVLVNATGRLSHAWAADPDEPEYGIGQPEG